MTTYTVVSRGKMWDVEANGRVVSKHRKKTRAVSKARDLADRNDSITVQNRKGRFQKRIRNP